jgi:hypothetical protein
MKLEEIVSVRDMRGVVKEKFKEYKDVKDQRVVDLLIFKGRQELEVRGLNTMGRACWCGGGGWGRRPARP